MIVKWITSHYVNLAFPLTLSGLLNESLRSLSESGVPTDFVRSQLERSQMAIVTLDAAILVNICWLPSLNFDHVIIGTLWQPWVRGPVINHHNSNIHWMNGCTSRTTYNVKSSHGLILNLTDYHTLKCIYKHYTNLMVYKCIGCNSIISRYNFQWSHWLEMMTAIPVSLTSVCEFVAASPWNCGIWPCFCSCWCLK